MLDTLKYYKKLIVAGVPEQQAEVHVEALDAAIAGKIDIIKYEQKLREAGIPGKHAEAIANILQDIMIKIS